MKTYHGSCHCGAVKFTVTTTLDKVVNCNCSICTKKGALHHRVSADQFKLLSGEEALSLYQFDSKEAKHLFCKHCGIHAFCHPRLDPRMVSVNARCLDDFDIHSEHYDTVVFDGRNWEQAAAKLKNPS